MSDRAAPDPSTFLSGDAGDVTSPRRRLKRTLGDLAADAIAAATFSGPRLDRLAARQERRRLLVLGIARPGSLLASALPALRSTRHEVTFSLGALGDPDRELSALTTVRGLTGGKLENLNALLAAMPDQAAACDWLLVVDDDIALPPRFLDRFLALAERFELDLAQPAQTLRSHSAWKVTRRRPGALVRETRFVEIGPLTAFRGPVAAELTPFPALRFGWGLDLHWAALAAERGWRLGVVDATPVRHETGLVAAAYSNAEAEAEAARFLADRPYLPSTAAAEVLATHRALGRLLSSP
jgi:hypothetical protein